MPKASYSTKEILQIFKEKYNNKYNYPNLQYKGLNSKIKIVCNKHGEFIQRLSKHLKSNGNCKGCLFDELKQKLSSIHNNKYNYDKLINTKTHNKNIIVCKVHGEFNQTINSHKNGYGCNKCAINNKTKTKENFIKKSNEKHKNKYDYSKFIYTNWCTKSIIICPKHGEFLQTPHAHKKHGCKKCAGNEKYTSKTFKTKYFKLYPESNLVLENINYINIDTKILVCCLNHKNKYYFDILPRNLLGGVGCNKCGGTKKLTQEEFIKIANNIHDNKYDYSKVKYINARSKIKIICPHHSETFEFITTSGTHIHNKRGCPKCAHIISKPEIQWLKSFNNPNIIKQKTVTLDNRRFRFDGYDPKTNTVYEFYGDFWHGNPNKFDQNKIHPIKKINGKPATFKEIYDFTIKGEQILKKHGFKIISIWESDFKT